MTLKISILTVFAQLYEPFLKTSLINRAQKNNLLHCDVEDLFSYVESKERIDAPTYGPGSGMVIRPEIIEKAIEVKERNHGKAFKIFFSPQGERLDQRVLASIAQSAQQYGHVMMLPARYEGMDARVEEYYADKIVSVGDFVLMAGDLPALMLLEGMLRLIPGVVGKQDSVEHESFTGPFVDYPEYAPPVIWKGKTVPEIVRSGNHAEIARWRMQQAAQKTVIHHFAWMRSQKMSFEQRMTAAHYIPSHYVALMHSNVCIGDQRQEGTTSVTSMDIHDIARSACTYNLKNYFIVTPLIDQQRIVEKFLDFWATGFGREYNESRSHALDLVHVMNDLDKTIEYIVQKEGKKPLLIATSAQIHDHIKTISFYDQEQVWKLDRPVLFILGTGKGLTNELVQKCDFLLLPVEGFSSFNHLSVRSAASIIFDRWLGINIKCW